MTLGGIAKSRLLKTISYEDTDFGVLSSNEVRIGTVERETKEQHQQYFDLGEQVLEQVDKQLGENAIAKEQVVDWLLKQPNVAEAGVSFEGGSIGYEGVDGLRGGILVNKPGVKGAVDEGIAAQPELELVDRTDMFQLGISLSSIVPSSRSE
ncbi:hypothetical protein I6N90_21530 [Paenibacillus sp. GSMTC-2017]|uniref:hypothetical protein n=1 Tax=Paenibacillus sp. GSMTC-2017 TaxID=2794350 RepID=UPI0018D65A51|nr:hypothetical protein [Paenibacillus sp. GSMTC-2017]MBH5320378.1 hypothetical protein [Paenibacillus sp. GSMTC-2017]